MGTATCDWNGGELIPGPGAQMLQCTPTKCDISNPYCRTGKEGAYCDYEDPDKSRDARTVLVSVLDFQRCQILLDLLRPGFDPWIPA